jgi:hypothetical protein
MSVLSVKIFLISDARTHSFLPQHFAQSHRVIVRIDSDNLALGVVRLKVL